MDVFLQPVLDRLDKLGINKTANEGTRAAPIGELTNSELVKELGKLAGDMPEDLAGQKMHDEKTPLDSPEAAPAAPTIENNKDDAYRLQQRTDDNLDSLSQTSAPLSNPSDLDTDQDPLARMAAKIACAIEPLLADADDKVQKTAGVIHSMLLKTSAPSFQGVRDWIGKHPEKAVAIGMAGGTAIGGGLGFFGGKQHERKKDETEDGAILQLGAEIGGRMAANQIFQQLEEAANAPTPGKEG